MNQLEQTKQALEKNNIPCSVFADRIKARDYIIGEIRAGSTVSFGGSMTLTEDLAIYSEISKKATLIDPRDEQLTEEAKGEARRAVFWADYFLTSSNAVTLEGELVNTDGTGNRIAAIALAFGPKKVFVVAGRNKIVKDRQEAYDRIREIAAPLNVKRLGRETGCTETGYCTDCKTAERICCHTLITQFQKKQDRIEVILIDEDLGY